MTSGDLAARKLARTAFHIRAVAAIAIHLFAPVGLFAPDEQTYDAYGWFLAQYWRGDLSVNYVAGLSTQGYYHIVALLYMPFGQFPLLPKLLSAWIGSLAVLELFRVTRLIGGSESASLRAAQFMAFFPSMILWSSVMVRDVWVQWLLLRIAREMGELRGRFIASRIATVILMIWALTSFRAYLLYAALGPLAISFVISRSKDIIRNVILGALLALALTYAGMQGGGAEAKVQSMDLAELQRLRSWSSSGVAESAFGADADISTLGGALSFLPTGLAYFFFAPFPWQLGSMRQALAIPETLYFYTLVPGIFAGAAFLLRKRLGDSIGIMLMTLTVTFGYAIGQGNVGTLYRHKAQVMGFYYAFAAIGMENRRRKQPVRFYPGYALTPRDPARPRIVTASSDLPRES